MKAYSEDLRERVIRAVEAGRPRDEVAARFEVSVPTIERWVRLKRETGGLARRPVPGSGAVKTAGLTEALPARLAERADATLAEHCAWWRQVSGFEVSAATMSRAIRCLGWTRKKRRWERANATR
jgi:transposase